MLTYRRRRVLCCVAAFLLHRNTGGLHGNCSRPRAEPRHHAPHPARHRPDRTGLAITAAAPPVLRELQACEDRDLRDLGISRYDFMAIANGSYRR